MLSSDLEYGIVAGTVTELYVTNDRTESARNSFRALMSDLRGLLPTIRSGGVSRRDELSLILPADLSEHTAHIVAGYLRESWLQFASGEHASARES